MKRLARWGLVAMLVVSVMVSAPPASAAGPQVDWDCKLMRLQGSTGTYVYFDPRAEVEWSGRTLKFKMWAWSSRDTRKSQAGKTYGKVKSKSGGRKTTDLDLSTEFLFGAESYYKKIRVKVTDSRGRSSKHTCIWEGPVAAGW